MNKKNPNEIYDDRVIKTSLNIKRDVMIQVKKRMRDLDIECFSWYIRALINQDLEALKNVTLSEFMGIKRKTQQEQIDEILLRVKNNPIPESKKISIVEMPAHQDYVDPPRRYSGFIAGQLRNIFVLWWAKKKNEQYKINQSST